MSALVQLNDNQGLNILFAAVNQVEPIVIALPKDIFLSKVYAPGSIVYFQGKPAEIKSYNSHTNNFTVNQDGKEIKANRNVLVLLPVAGQDYFVRLKTPTCSANQALTYCVEKIEMAELNKIIRSGRGLNSVNIEINHNGNLDTRNINKLDSILPINDVSKQMPSKVGRNKTTYTYQD